MKIPELKQIIKEEITKIVNELHTNTLRQINKYIDDTHHTESNSFLDDIGIPDHVPFSSIYQLRDMVNGFLDSPKGSEAEEVFRDTIIYHLKTAGKGFTDKQIKEYIQLLELRRDKEQIGGVKLNESYTSKKSQLKQIIKEEIAKILTENEYLDQLLDKISASGMDSLSAEEKKDLDRYHKGEDPTPKKFKIRIEKDIFGGYEAFVYKENNRWIPDHIFDIINSSKLDPPIDSNRFQMYFAPDLDIKTLNGAMIKGDKKGEVLEFFKDEGNMNDLIPSSSGTTSIRVPRKYIDALKY
jgi:hypothetical protein